MSVDTIRFGHVYMLIIQTHTNTGTARFFGTFSARMTQARLYRVVLYRNNISVLKYQHLSPYISELHDRAGEFGEFLVWLAATFLCSWEKTVKKMEFQDLVLFLQQLPTENWRVRDVELLLTNSHVSKISFAGTNENAVLLSALRR